MQAPQLPPMLQPAQFRPQFTAGGLNVQAPFGGYTVKGFEGALGEGAAPTGIGAIGGIAGFGPGAFDVHRKLMPFGIDNHIGNLI